MPRCVFVRGEYFDISVTNEKDKKGLVGVAEESSRDNVSFEDLRDRIAPYNAHVGNQRDELPENFVVHKLPLTIRRLPVYYEHPAGNLLIGNVDAVRD